MTFTTASRFLECFPRSLDPVLQELALSALVPSIVRQQTCAFPSRLSFGRHRGTISSSAMTTNTTLILTSSPAFRDGALHQVTRGSDSHRLSYTHPSEAATLHHRPNVIHQPSNPDERGPSAVKPSVSESDYEVLDDVCFPQWAPGAFYGASRNLLDYTTYTLPKLQRFITDKRGPPAVKPSVLESRSMLAATQTRITAIQVALGAFQGAPNTCAKVQDTRSVAFVQSLSTEGKSRPETMTTASCADM